MNNILQTAVAQIRKAGNAMLNLLFPCPHRSKSVPFTPISKSDQPHAATYVTCLDCGTTFYYDWMKMRIGRPMPKLPHAYSNVDLRTLDVRRSSHGFNGDLIRASD
jgi:hypothetical protein